MQYFKHMSNMRNDVKIRRIINRYGLEGYGLYCLVLESITESLTTKSPIPDLQETCVDIAEFYKADTTQVNEMMSFMINNGLFEVDEYSQRVVCDKLYKFLEASQTRSTELRQMITEYRNRVSLPEPSQMSVTVCDISEEENRKEENRKEENSAPKAHYADTVTLTEKEYVNLTTKYGEAQTKKLIDKLDAYKQSKGKKYKSDAAAIRTWVVDAVKPKEVHDYNVCEICGENFDGKGKRCKTCK